MSSCATAPRSGFVRSGRRIATVFSGSWRRSRRSRAGSGSSRAAATSSRPRRGPQTSTTSIASASWRPSARRADRRPCGVDPNGRRTRRGGVRRRRRTAGPRRRDDPARPPRGRRARPRRPYVHGDRPAGEPPDAAGVPRQRLPVVGPVGARASSRSSCRRRSRRRQAASRTATGSPRRPRSPACSSPRRSRSSARRTAPARSARRSRATSRRRVLGRHAPRQPPRRHGGGRAVHRSVLDMRARSTSPSSPSPPKPWSGSRASAPGRAPARSSSSPPASPRSAPEGAQRQRDLLEVCRESGMRLVGPNCLGVLNTGADRTERDVRPDRAAARHRGVHVAERRHRDRGHRAFRRRPRGNTP